jgi:hypothetical protein
LADSHHECCNKIASVLGLEVATTATALAAELVPQVTQAGGRPVMTPIAGHPAASAPPPPATTAHVWPGRSPDVGHQVTRSRELSRLSASHAELRLAHAHASAPGQRRRTSLAGLLCAPAGWHARSAKRSCHPSSAHRQALAGASSEPQYAAKWQPHPYVHLSSPRRPLRLSRPRRPLRASTPPHCRSRPCLVICPRQGGLGGREPPLSSAIARPRFWLPRRMAPRRTGSYSRPQRPRLPVLAHHG